MTSFTFTENKLALIQERYPSLQFEIVSKQCDFCGAALDKEFASETCACGTVFDQCDECKQSQHYESGRCHIANHDDPSQLKQLSAEEISVVENREKKEVLRMFGMSMSGRMRLARQIRYGKDDKDDDEESDDKENDYWKDDDNDRNDDDNDYDNDNTERARETEKKDQLRLDMSTAYAAANFPALSQSVKDGAEFYIEKASVSDYGSVVLVMKI